MVLQDLPQYSQPSSPVMLPVKFDHLPTGLGDILVRKCGHMDGGTDDGALISYKLTLWACVVICKFNEDPIKIKLLLSGQHFAYYMFTID